MRDTFVTFWIVPSRPEATTACLELEVAALPSPADATGGLPIRGVARGGWQPLGYPSYPGLE
jgi:hypothetical protein